MEKFDVIVIGSGPGGYPAAIRAAQLGKKVAIVEKYNTLGGTCLNVGCIPSKALLKSSENFWKAKNEYSHHGIQIDGISMDIPKMIQRKRKVVEQITGGVKLLIDGRKITHLVGHATIKSATEVEVAGQVYSTDKIIIATGSKPTPLRGVEFDKKRIVSSTEALELEELPKELLVVGAGVIGLEMGSVWARLGSKVKIIEYGDACLPGMDKHIQRQMKKSMEAMGCEFYFKTGITEGSVVGDKVQLAGKTQDGNDVSFEGDYCLVAIGRRPYTDNLGLENVGIALDQRGFIQVNSHYQTSVSNIYAIGDVIGGLMLAHKAEEEGIAAAEIICGKAGHVNYNAIPGVVYTDPEVAVIGKTEDQLKAEKIAFNTGKFNFAANGRAVASDEGVGFVKVLAHKETDEILGVHMIGPHVSEMINEISLAMEYKASSEDVGITCHAHPTLAETIKEAALAATKRAIHAL